jgi:hypothetical protein
MPLPRRVGYPTAAHYTAGHRPPPDLARSLPSGRGPGSAPGQYRVQLSVVRAWVGRPGSTRVSQRARAAGRWSAGAVEKSR